MSSMQLSTIHKFQGFSTTPLGKLTVENAKVIVELTVENVSIRVVFAPYQAVRVTTADCFLVAPDAFIEPRTIMEMSNSQWIEQLSGSLSQVDETATFLTQTRHFLVACQDNFIEIIAWDYELMSNENINQIH